MSPKKGVEFSQDLSTGKVYSTHFNSLSSEQKAKAFLTYMEHETLLEKFQNWLESRQQAFAAWYATLIDPRK